MKLMITGLILIALTIGVAPAVQAQDILTDLQMDPLRIVDNALRTSPSYGHFGSSYYGNRRYRDYRQSTGARILEDTIADARDQIMWERRYGRIERTERRRADDYGRGKDEGYDAGIRRGRNETAREYEARIERLELENERRELERQRKELESKEAELATKSSRVLRAEDVACNDSTHPTTDARRVRIINPTSDKTFRISGGLYVGENRISLGPNAEACPLKASAARDAGLDIRWTTFDTTGQPVTCKAHLQGSRETDTAYIVADPDACEVAE